MNKQDRTAFGSDEPVIPVALFGDVHQAPDEGNPGIQEALAVLLQEGLVAQPPEKEAIQDALAVLLEEGLVAQPTENDTQELCPILLVKEEEDDAVGEEIKDAPTNNEGLEILFSSRIESKDLNILDFRVCDKVGGRLVSKITGKPIIVQIEPVHDTWASDSFTSYVDGRGQRNYLYAHFLIENHDVPDDYLLKCSFADKQNRAAFEGFSIDPGYIGSPLYQRTVYNHGTFHGQALPEQPPICLNAPAMYYLKPHYPPAGKTASAWEKLYVNPNPRPSIAPNFITFNRLVHAGIAFLVQSLEDKKFYSLFKIRYGRIRREINRLRPECLVPLHFQDDNFSAETNFAAYNCLGTPVRAFSTFAPDGVEMIHISLVALRANAEYHQTTNPSERKKIM